MRVYDRFADEYIDEMEKDPIAPPERYIELSEELILKNAARWFCQALVDDSAEKESDAPSAEAVHKPDYSYEADMVRRLKESLSAKAVQGEWVRKSGYVTPGGDPVWVCSKCGKGMHVYGVEHDSYGKDVSDGQWVACPNCGAKMKGADDEADNN